jgi:hypothetical protein
MRRAGRLMGALKTRKLLEARRVSSRESKKS